ncbi:hypothetical protein L3Q82_024459 [Scortum barcoo]|uniref:Uncharacterized protein n=1 Tax=Scortum barcoo TaxID=214431 RepID=A0ACB8WR56_9TELE|nr:hypothetical protein L3Q82_024459 [Scortum barcoo]
MDHRHLTGRPQYVRLGDKVRTPHRQTGCIRSGQEDEYRELIKDLSRCDESPRPRRPRPHPEPVIIKWDCHSKGMEVVHTYKYLSWMINWMDCQHTLCAGKDRAACASSEGWRPSTSARSCCRSSTISALL